MEAIRQQTASARRRRRRPLTIAVLAVTTGLPMTISSPRAEAAESNVFFYYNKYRSVGRTAPGTLRLWRQYSNGWFQERNGGWTHDNGCGTWYRLENALYATQFVGNCRAWLEHWGGTTAWTYVTC